LQAPSPWGDLEEVLARAATKDRTVIMTQINAAWTRPGSLLDLFFESFRTGEGGVARLLDHLVIVTMDPAAYEGCKVVHRHCYFLRTSNGVDYRSEKMFMSKDYLEMMWGRNRFQQTVLQLGYNFLFTVSTFFRIFVVANNYARVTRANDVSSLGYGVLFYSSEVVVEQSWRVQSLVASLRRAPRCPPTAGREMSTGATAAQLGL
jgi:hypothetical protein